MTLNSANYSTKTKGVFVNKTDNGQFQAWSDGTLGEGNTISEAKLNLAEAERFFANPEWENCLIDECS